MATAYFVVFLNRADNFKVVGRGIYSEEHPTTTGSIESRLVCKMEAETYQEASDKLERSFTFVTANDWKWKKAH